MLKLYSPDILQKELGLNPKYYNNFSKYIQQSIGKLDNINKPIPSLRCFFSDWLVDTKIQIQQILIKTFGLTEKQVRFGIYFGYDENKQDFDLIEFNNDYISETEFNKVTYPQMYINKRLSKFFLNNVINILEFSLCDDITTPLSIAINVQCLKYRQFSLTSIDSFKDLYNIQLNGDHDVSLVELLQRLLDSIYNNPNALEHLAFLRELLCYFAYYIIFAPKLENTVFTQQIQKYFDYCIQYNIFLAEEILIMYNEGEISTDSNIFSLISAYEEVQNIDARDFICSLYNKEDYIDNIWRTHYNWDQWRLT